MVYPNYEPNDSTETRLQKCIAFELERGGDTLAAARAILRDVALGHIVLNVPERPTAGDADDENHEGPVKCRPTA